MGVMRHNSTAHVPSASFLEVVTVLPSCVTSCQPSLTPRKMLKRGQGLLSPGLGLAERKFPAGHHILGCLFPHMSIHETQRELEKGLLSILYQWNPFQAVNTACVSKQG